MDRSESTVARLSHFVHAHFLWLMLASYLIAAFCPALGLWFRDISFGSVHLFGGTTKISLSMLMLASLLLNAGLGVRASQIGEMIRRPSMLGAGLIANLLIPITFIGAITIVMGFWHNPDEVQNILVGLALVASMPIAGSSTAWSQNAEGELSLSLGLVLGSTLLSPLTTPIALHTVGLMTTGDYSSDLHALAANGTGGFLALCVLAPSVLGIVLRRALGESRTAAVKPRLKILNSAILLVLNYSNASVSLPQAIAKPDLDFLAITLLIVVGLCVCAFTSGWGIARVLKATPAQRTALMFGLGMNNNGTGLVLASMALADHPAVMLPIIFYNLAQHLVAGVVDRYICNPPSTPRTPEESALQQIGLSNQAYAS